MTLGELITDYRNSHGMSMREFARRSGLSVTYISSIEKETTYRGNKPSLTFESFEAIAKVMGMTVDELLRQADDYDSLNTVPAVNLGLISKEEYDDFVAPWGGMSEEMQHAFEWYYAYSKMSDECKVIARAMINSDNKGGDAK